MPGGHITIVTGADDALPRACAPTSMRRGDDAPARAALRAVTRHCARSRIVPARGAPVGAIVLGHALAPMERKRARMSAATGTDVAGGQAAAGDARRRSQEPPGDGGGAGRIRGGAGPAVDEAAGRPREREERR